MHAAEGSSKQVHMKTSWHYALLLGSMCNYSALHTHFPFKFYMANLLAVFPARGMRAWEQLCGIIGGEGSPVHKYAGTCIVFQPLLLTLSFVLAALHGVCVGNRLENRRAFERAVAGKICVVRRSALLRNGIPN